MSEQGPYRLWFFSRAAFSGWCPETHRKHHQMELGDFRSPFFWRARFLKEIPGKRNSRTSTGSPRKILWGKNHRCELFCLFFQEIMWTRGSENFWKDSPCKFPFLHFWLKRLNLGSRKRGRTCLGRGGGKQRKKGSSSRETGSPPVWQTYQIGFPAQPLIERQTHNRICTAPFKKVETRHRIWPGEGFTVHWKWSPPSPGSLKALLFPSLVKKHKTRGHKGRERGTTRNFLHSFPLSGTPVVQSFWAWGNDADRTHPSLQPHTGVRPAIYGTNTSKFVPSHWG